MILKFRLFILLMFCSVFQLPASPIKFYSINSKFGISTRETSSICKDKNGFIWAASKTGILRITDDDYRVYQLPYEFSDVIDVKLIYKNSQLIAFTNSGQIFMYNTVLDRFEMILVLHKELNDKHLTVKGILIDDHGIYWIALTNGLYKYQSGKLSLVYNISSERYSITWYDKQSIIIAQTEGIWLLDIKSLKRKSIYKNNSITPFMVSKLYFDKNQNILWIGTVSNGLFCFNFQSKILFPINKPISPRQPIRAIEENTDSTILIGIDGQGIWEISKKNFKVLNVYKESADDPYSLRGNGVYDIFCDDNKRVWICTFSGGVSFYNQKYPLVNQIVHQINNSNSLVNNEVNSIIEDSDGKIWFATNNGISCWDALSNQWKSYYSNELEQAQVFLTLCEDDQGKIWAGSFSSGIYVLDKKTGKELAHYSRDTKGSPLVSDFILSIFKDSQGDIWIGGVNGEFICYFSKQGRFRTYSTEPINYFSEISPNQILLGCSYGLALLDKQSGVITKLLLDFVVQDIIIIGNEIWMSTSGDGLIRYNYKTGKLEKFTIQSGLPSNFINAITYTGDYLWLGTEGGLCRFDPRNNDILTFSSILPLSGISYNRHSRCKLANGQLAWGTNNGAVFFAPDSIMEVPSIGKIFLQDLAISGLSIREIPSFNLNCPVDSLKEISLKYYQNNISIELLPIGTPAGSKFSWEMNGFDKNWTSPSENRLLNYTNIPSGTFVLKIKLYNSSLSQVISERLLKIRVIPPFWRTGWFWMIILIVFSGIIVLYMLYYINRIKQKHSEEKIHFFTNTAHDIRNSLTLIKAPVEELSRESNLSTSGQYFLNLAIEQVRRLSFVVTQLLDFQKVDIGKEQIALSMVDIVKMISNRRLMYESFSRSKNIELVFTSDCASFKSAVDEAKIEKVLDNLISNALKYSHPGNQVLIDLKCDKNNWILQVKDHGIGISRKAQRQLFKEFHRGDNAINSKIVGSGIGLLLVKNYVTMHGGKIICASQENIGSVFNVYIPYKEISKESKNIKTIGTEQNVPVRSMEENQPVKAGFGITSANDMMVLIVEDNDDLLDFMRNTLGREFNVETAENGVKAWEFISKQMPDLIVSDVMMPDMDGFELCKLIKSTYETSHIPIILLTGLSEKAEQLHGLGLGADDYLIKPFDMNLLVQRIKTLINNRIAVREKALKLIRGNTTEPLLTNELNDKFVKKMLEIARTNISNSEFNKDIFASEMNVSTSLLYKKIKSLTDQSPTDFIKTIRLDYAVELLQSQKYNITEVSELCGFTSVGYFSTVFKKHFGKSPANLLH